MTVPAVGDEYTSGFAAGVISTRLDGLEAHDIRANGHLADILTVVKTLQEDMQIVRMELARLAQDAVAKEATVKATAEGVESARITTARQIDQQRINSEVMQVPWARAFSAIAAIAAIVSIVYAVRH